MLWEENEPAFTVFLSVRTQLRSVGMGRISGLDYTAVITYINFMEFPDKHELFQQVQLIESGVIKSVSQQTS